MAVTLDELEDLIKNTKYARFINTNLHMHTPATPKDWDSFDNQTFASKDITPEIYFDELNKTSLELVAITDHNSINWCEPLMKLANEARKRGISKLHILPGVEITTYEGPHLIAIFQEDFQVLPKIRDLLTKLDLSGTGQRGERVSKGEDDQITIKKVMKWVVDLDGLIIGPHIQSEDGIWGCKTFKGREDILNDPNLRILAAPSGDIKIVIENEKRRLLYKNMPSGAVLNSFAFINISDCHRLEDFELNTTWIKVSEPTLDGVKQIIFEPELRISHRKIETDHKVDYPFAFEFSTPTDVTHDHVIGMAITGGMFNGLKISFSPHQNSIIGKNYAGKSAILDCLRFVTNNFPNTDNDIHHKLADRLRGILLEGGQVRTYVQKNGSIFALSRTLSVSRAKSQLWIDGDSEVYSLIGKEFRRESDLSATEICKIETYAQGEVVKIKDNSTRQMPILDSLSKIDVLLRDLDQNNIEDEGTLIGKLSQNSKQILQFRAEESALSEGINNINDLEKEIKELEDLASSPLLEDIKQWGAIENKISGFLRRLNEMKIGVEDLQNRLPSECHQLKEIKEKDIKSVTREELLEYAENIFMTSMNNLSSSLVNISFDQVIIKLEFVKEEVKRRIGEVADKFRGETDADSAKAQLAERITEKKGRLDFLLEQKAKLQDIQVKEEASIIKRSELLREYENVWMKIRLARISVVELINNTSPDDIQAELIESGDRTLYRTKLEEIADNLTSSSNKIANKQNQLDLISENITPDQLIQIVKDCDITKLVTEAHITENTARVLIGMGESDIHGLEITKLHDKFVIKYKKEGDSIFTPIDSGLSGGEQALALLSVALVQKEFPLLIDQPEDELGTALITKNLVEQIRNVKHNRQLILITHIANIPVLADSENVIYVQQNIEGVKRTIIIKCTGSLENKEIIEHLLELDGGKYAFRKRNERYSIVLKES